MCGIVGVITAENNGFSYEDLKILKDNMFINQLRGWDSTGMFGVSKENDVQWMKVVGDLVNFTKSDLWKDKLEGLEEFLWRRGKIAIGHGRAATIGKISPENAHPFVITREDDSKVVLVHNGTLDAWQNLPDFSKFDVDSHWIADAIVRHGVKEALSRIRGAIATIWYDTQDRTLNFYRNDQRPLHFIITKRGKLKPSSIIINSVPDPLRWLVDRYHLQYDEPNNGVLYFAPETHYQLSLDNPLGPWNKVEKIERKYVVPASSKWDREDNVWKNRRRGIIDITSEEDNLNFLEHFTEEDRTFELDGLRILLGTYKQITFEDGVIKYEKNKGVVETHQGQPYLPELYCMRASNYNKNQLVSEFKKGGIITNTTYSYTFELVETIKDEFKERLNRKRLPVIVQKDEAQFVDIGLKKFRRGKQIQWHSKDCQNFVIRNTAIVASDLEPIFERYSNQDDGLFVIGDEVLMEVSDIKLIKMNQTHEVKIRQCFGTPVLVNAHAKAIECSFYDVSAETDEELKKMIFKGKVNTIKLNNPERFEQSHKQILISLVHVKPYGDSEQDAA